MDVLNDGSFFINSISSNRVFENTVSKPDNPFKCKNELINVYIADQLIFFTDCHV